MLQSAQKSPDQNLSAAQPPQAVTTPQSSSQASVQGTGEKPSLFIPKSKLILAFLTLFTLAVLVVLGFWFSGKFEKEQSAVAPLTEEQMIAVFRERGFLSPVFEERVIEKKSPEELRISEATVSTRNKLGLSSLPSTYEYTAYAEQFGRLLGEYYYKLRDPEILELVRGWQSIVAAKFPEEYARGEEEGVYTIEQ